MEGKTIRLIYNYLKINLSTALEYRMNFAIGIIGMIINDLVWIFFWSIILNKFDTINGWGFENILRLFALITICWGITGILFGNRGHLAQIIETGDLDFYLAIPENVLAHMLTARLNLGSMGDLIFGIIVSFFCISISQLPVFLILIITGSTTILAFCILVGSLSFFFGSSKALERSFIMGILTLSSYPFSIFGGFAKFLLLTVIPAGLVTGIPVEILGSFDLKLFFFIIGFSIVFLLISIKVFSIGLRRYESGNLIVARI